MIAALKQVEAGRTVDDVYALEQTHGQQLGMLRGPSHRRDVRDSLNGCVCEAGQDVGQVVADRDLEPSTAFHNREDGSYPCPSLLAADMNPVGAANGDWAH